MIKSNWSHVIGWSWYKDHNFFQRFSCYSFWGYSLFDFSLMLFYYIVIGQERTESYTREFCLTVRFYIFLVVPFHLKSKTFQFHLDGMLSIQMDVQTIYWLEKFTIVRYIKYNISYNITLMMHYRYRLWQFKLCRWNVVILQL